MTTAKELLKEAVEKLKPEGIDTPQLDAEVILCNLLKIERVKLHIYPEMEISREICQRFWQDVEKRLEHMPVQYITNRQEFMGLDFFVEEGVLIPRGDTEILVEQVIALYKENYDSEPVELVEIGVGSGAISVSIAAFIQECSIHAIDISPKALEVSRKNAIANNVEEQITFHEGNLFEPISKTNRTEGFDFIVSNPPYIPRKTIEILSKQVKHYEPSLALDGGEDGLDFYRQIVEEAPLFLKKEGWLALEIGHDQGKALKDMMEKKGFRCIEIIKDLAGLDRVIIGRRGRGINIK